MQVHVTIMIQGRVDRKEGAGGLGRGDGQQRGAGRGRWVMGMDGL